MQKSIFSWVAAVGACTPLLAIAQSTGPATTAARLDYVSAFADYQPFQELEPGDWRALNDAVGAAAARHGLGQPVQVAPVAAPALAPQSGPPVPERRSMPGTGHPRHGGQP